MSIQSEINRLKQNVSAAFTAIGNKGGTVPASKVSGNLATAINSIPDGVELNFEVVGGTSQPNNPKENTIWINTSTSVNSWVFSATQPSNPVNGMVWISTGSDSIVEFNALKENGLQVYPISAKQYVSGACVGKNAMTYQGGVWKSWIEVIDFNETDWTKKNPYPSRSYTMGTYDLSNKTLKGKVTGSYQHVVMVKNAKIDFSAAKYLKFNYSLDKSISNTGSIIVKVSSSNSDPTDSSCVVNQKMTAVATNQEVSIPVSTVNGSYYLWVGMALWGNSGTVNFEVSNLHLSEV